MSRKLNSFLAAVAMFAAAAHAQCLPSTSGTPVTLTATTTFPVDDEGISAPLPLGFSFPMAGGPFTHVAVESNGVAYLTTGGAPVGTTTFGFQDMAGVAGDSPRIAAYWADLEGVSPSWQITTDASVPGQFKISWVDVNEYFTSNTFTVQVILYSSGQIDFSSTNGLSVTNFQATIGASEGNGVFGASSDLSAGASSTNNVLYEDFILSGIDLGGATTSLLPVGGGYLATRVCGPASHETYGAGCYDIPASFYEYFTASTIDLAGSGMTLLPNGSGYVALNAVTTYVAPSPAATSLALADDDETAVTLTGSFSYPGGSTSTLTVCSNGYVSAGPGNGTNFFPDVAEHLNSVDACWRTWRDYNPTIAGSGQVKFEQIGSVAYITWDGVYEFGTTSPDTFQMQFDTASGAVHFLWQTLAGQDDYLVGYSPGGNSIDPGSRDLSATLPASFSVNGADVLALALSASPAPVSTPTSGTVVTYTTDNIPELVPGSGVYVALNILSVGQVPAPGFDLSVIGAPGCVSLVPTLDFTQSMVGFSSSQSVTFALPAGVPAGFMIYSQSAALFTPGSLPGGLNAFGLLTSNGIASQVQPF
jgi:hypothetical protein